jgi:mono/diheme cytochrome c family protein
MTRAAAWVLAVGLGGAAGCDDMTVQPRQGAYAPLVGPAGIPNGTVEFEARPAKVPPVTQSLLERGRERYHIFCAPCHAELGDGQGMIVKRGFPAPPSFHSARLRAAPPRHLYDVITAGYGVMYSFADRIDSDDRWAIAAYVRALQRSQNAAPTEAIGASPASP